MAFGLSAASVGLLGIGASVAGGLLGSNSASNASDAQVQSAADSSAAQKEIAAQQISFLREQQIQNQLNQQPWLDAGRAGLTRLQQLLGLTSGGADNGSAMHDFSAQDFQSDPGYQFRVNQGQQALERSAAARGGLMSGAALKDTARFSQGLASQDYQDAFNRFQTNRANKLNPLQSLAGVGQTTANSLGAAGQSTANGISNALGQYGAAAGNNITGAGNARASGYLAQGNAVSGGLSSIANAYQQNALMNKYLGGGNSFAGMNSGLMQSQGLSASDLMGAF